MGTGKTLCATVVSLSLHLLARAQGQAYSTVVVMPPLLLTQWARWLRSLNPAPSVTVYRGTPAQRQRLSLDAPFVLVGVHIFKRDYERLSRHFAPRAFNLVIDEATMVCHVGTDTHAKLHEFGLGRVLLALTGTPSGKPLNAYGLMKFSAPGTYRSRTQFENLHVDTYDFFGQPSTYKNLELLASNLRKNARRILYEDMYAGVQAPQYTPWPYELDPAHLKLYHQLCEQQLLKLPQSPHQDGGPGGKIDATTENALTHALGQIVCNWGHFSGDARQSSKAIELVRHQLGALGSAKLVVFAHYRMTIANLLGALIEYGAVAVNGDVSTAQKERNVQRFIDDPQCRVILIQFKSGGYGLDGLQHVAHHALFIEPCQQSDTFNQCVARLKRTGQTRRVHVALAIAQGTTQVHGFSRLLSNDALSHRVARHAGELRQRIFGQSAAVS